MKTHANDPMVPALAGHASITVLPLLAVFALLACSRPSGHADSSGERPPVPVVVAAAVRKTVPVTLEAIGTAQSINTVAITARVAGQLTEVGFREGDEVEQGALLFQLDPRPFVLALELAEATLRRELVQLRNLERQHQRYAALVPKRLISRQEFETRTAAVRAQRGNVDAARAVVATARLNLGYTAVRAPISGRTGSLQVTVGNLVQADDTDRPLVFIRQLAPIHVRFAVPAPRLPEVRRAAAARPPRVEALIRGPAGGSHSGVLGFIDNAVDPATGTVALRAELANEQRALWPGQFVDVRLYLGELSNAVVIPAQALQTGQQGDFVFVVKQDGSVEARPVALGPRRGGEVVVARGLEAGEQVVTDGQFALAPGAKVKPGKPAGAPAQKAIGGSGRQIPRPEVRSD